MRSSTLFYFSPGRVLLGALCAVIGVGTFLLSLPAAQATPLNFFDVLFTTVSTVCVTGLATVPLSSFTMLGQSIILCLIQIGGLGLMTFSYFLLSLFLNLDMTTKLMAGELFEFESWSKVKTFLSLIFAVTLGFELCGAFSLYLSFSQYMEPHSALFYASFHSISAFCNGGISLFDHSLHQFSHNPLILGTISFLICAGGLGFIVWYELLQKARATLARFQQKPQGEATRRAGLSLHTKIVLGTTLMLTIIGACALWVLENNGAFNSFSRIDQMCNSLFYAISMRSAGFTTVDIATFAHGTIVILLALMFIGASPGSTGSGIKTTTFVLYCAAIGAILKNRDEIEISGRTIPSEQMYKAIAIITVSLAWILGSLFILSLCHPEIPFLSLIIESLSAFSTSGISTGITAQLSLLSKIVLMLSMIVGRIGPLTLVLAFKRKKAKQLYRYPEERILIG